MFKDLKYCYFLESESLGVVSTGLARAIGFGLAFALGWASAYRTPNGTIEILGAFRKAVWFHFK